MSSYEIGEVVGALFVTAVLTVIGVVMIVSDRRRTRRAEAERAWAQRSEALQAAELGGIHPAAYQPGGWLHAPGTVAQQADDPYALPESGPTYPAPAGPAVPAGPSSPPTSPGHGRLVLGCVLVALGVLLGASGVVRVVASPRHTVSLPSTVGGYAPLHTPALDAQVTTLRDRLDTVSGISNAQVGVYGPPGADKGAFFVEVTQHVHAGNVDDFFHGIGTSPQLALGSATETDPGPLGGKAECWSTAERAACAWADDSTFGLVLGASDSSAGIADVMRAVRAAAEH